MAAIGSVLAAELFGLEILRADIEDAERNTTRFVIMAPEAAQVEPDAAAITAVVFRVRNLPAALYKALGGFATNGINLTKIESYQRGTSFSVTHFYVEFEGHPAQARVARALHELEHFSPEFRVMGAFPAHPYRHELDGQTAPAR